MTIELSAQDEQIIERQIREGLHPDAGAVVAHALRLLETAEPGAQTQQQGTSLEAIERMFAVFDKHRYQGPKVPDSAFNRESIYQDHD